MANIYVVSDLHLGDGGIRDNFAYHGKRELFNAFLAMIERDAEAELLLLGDCFELWQGYGGKVFNANMELIDRLAAMPTAWAVFGNHDGEFAGGGAAKWLRHEWFRSRTLVRIDREIGGRRFTFAHGHEGDAFNDGDRPLSGNALTVLAGILEDRLGSRYLDSEQTIPLEAALTRFGDMILGFLDRLGDGFSAGRERGLDGGKSGYEKWADGKCAEMSEQDGIGTLDIAQRYVENEFSGYMNACVETGERGIMDIARNAGVWLHRLTGCGQGEQGELLNRHFRAMRQLLDERKSNVLVCGHTHVPGKIGDWYCNSGSWSDAGSDVLRIDETGDVSFFRCVRGAGGAVLEEAPSLEFVLL